tara:strand:+ start:217 stop:1059 length:843 start_codon:yes stop_codon:yes gene_type:complete
MSTENNFRNFMRNAYHRFGKRGFAGITAASRVLPDFIIIGTVRSGSTSLYHNICEHPSVIEAAYDEIGFFDSNYHLGESWYRSMFPTQKMMDNIRKNTGHSITGEDTPFYFWKEEVIKKILKLIPKIKLISIFRNPVDRAYSNYQLGIRTKTEKLTFEEAIEEEISTLEKFSFRECIERKRSYLAKSLYENQIHGWLDGFPKNQIHFLSTEEMQSNPQGSLQRIFEFLNISDYNIKNPRKQKSFDYEDMNIETRKKLLEFFEPHNQKFFDSIKMKFEWNQ